MFNSFLEVSIYFLKNDMFQVYNIKVQQLYIVQQLTIECLALKVLSPSITTQLTPFALFTYSQAPSPSLVVTTNLFSVSVHL